MRRSATEEDSMRLPALALLVGLVSLPAAGATIDLKNGDQLTGEIVERTDTQMVVEHAVLGRLTIPLEQVKPPASENKGLFGTSFLAGWSRHFQVGLAGAQGNSKNTDVAAALDLDYSDERKRWAFDAVYQFGSSDGDTSQHNALLALRRDWLVGDSHWFFFALGRGEYDQFKSWRYRLHGAPGVGYEFVNTERWNLRGLLGPALTKEFDESEFYVEALVGIESAWTFNKVHSLTFTNTIFPALNDIGEFRNLSALRWRWRLAESPALSLNAGVQNEYQSQVADDRKHNDLRYTTALGIDF
jgi:putative salt-induced outer membrane protein YdiY